MTREYVLRTLLEEHLWKAGESDTFEVMLSSKWEFTLCREEELYSPFRYSLRGRKVGTSETWSRQYYDMKSAFLHIVNHLNENAVVRNRYNGIEEWILKGKDM